MSRVPSNSLNIITAIHTQQEAAKTTRGRVEKASSHFQPNVGMTTIASNTSNTAPKAQNTY